MEVLNKLKNFDAYPKTLEDFRVRTYSGAAVSIISGLIILFLFLSEFAFYLRTDITPELFVDTSRGDKLKINIDVTFPKLPCDYLSLDAVDVSGDQQLDIQHNVFKRPLDSEGRAKGPEESITKLGTSKEEENPAAPAEPTGCGSCYGAESESFPCCNTCEDVREAYRQKGWAFSDPDNIAQCQREGWRKKMTDQIGEGCQVYGYLLVNKVAGNFHFAPGKSFQQQGVHVHDLVPFKMGSFNLSHSIHKLSFGSDFAGMINPLDGVSKKAEGGTSRMFQYYLKIVPTLYETSDGVVIKTNQFSVTEHERVLDHSVGGHGIPGVFFMYDLSPIMVKFSAKSKSFAHFLTGICAIIGGVFTVAGIIDSFIYHSLHTLQKKIELGKTN